MRTAVSALMLVALVSGCAVQGKAVEAHFWDPCTELSDQALREAGAKPETKDDAIQFEGINMCGWGTNVDHFRLNIYSTERPLSSFRTNPKFSKFADITVGGRQALRYQSATLRGGACIVGFDTKRGSVHVEMGQANPEVDACPAAIEIAGRLLPHLPN